MVSRAARGLAFDHEREADLVAAPRDPGTAAAWLDIAAPVGDSGRIDPRIARLVSVLRDDPAVTRPAGELAACVGLSESRLLHLFRAETGTSLRAYRLWTRLLHAARAVATGSDLTAAAADAGFASPSHLAGRFKATFGLNATSLLSTGVALHVTE
ncbi:helix-turn-helix domain-containing protein [Prauserella alba]|uniref:HTH araC/xylS-type domain-containing protein n=1 Tax=Prauserella alba TaxID=176898 RepID=A0ABN1VFG1_9PSEU|nr:AraC family transcriptional regulator [Prauserella alba]